MRTKKQTLKGVNKYVVRGFVYDGGEVIKETFDNVDEAIDKAREIQNGWTDDGTFYDITIYNEQGKKVASISDDKYFNDLVENKVFKKVDLSAETKKEREIENQKLKGYKFKLVVRIADGGATGIYEKTFDSIFDLMDKMNYYYEENYYATINNEDLDEWEDRIYDMDENRNYIKGKYGWSFIKEGKLWIAKDDYENNHIVRIIDGKLTSDSSVSKSALKQIAELESQKKYEGDSLKPKVMKNQKNTTPTRMMVRKRKQYADGGEMDGLKMYEGQAYLNWINGDGVEDELKTNRYIKASNEKQAEELFISRLELDTYTSRNNWSYERISIQLVTDQEELEYAENRGYLSQNNNNTYAGGGQIPEPSLYKIIIGEQFVYNPNGVDYVMIYFDKPYSYVVKGFKDNKAFEKTFKHDFFEAEEFYMKNAKKIKSAHKDKNAGDGELSESKMKVEKKGVIKNGDSVIMYFNKDTQLEIFESEDDEQEPMVDVFKKGEKFEVDIFGVDDRKYDVEFGDGSISFIRKDSVTIVSVNGNKFAGGGVMSDGRFKLRGFPPIDKFELMELYYDFQENFNSNIERFTKHYNRVHDSKLRLIDVKELFDYAKLIFENKTEFADGGETGELKIKLNELDSDGNTSVEYDEENEEWYWEDYSNDSYRGGFESELEAYEDLIDYLESDEEYADGGETGELKNVRGEAFYITESSAKDSGRDFDSLADTHFGSKNQFEVYLGGAIKVFIFDVNVKNQWNIVQAIYDQMETEGLMANDENIQIIGFELDRYPKSDFESELPYEIEDEDYDDEDDDEDDDDDYAGGGRVNNGYLYFPIGDVDYQLEQGKIKVGDVVNYVFHTPYNREYDPKDSRVLLGNKYKVVDIQIASLSAQKLGEAPKRKFTIEQISGTKNPMVKDFVIEGKYAESSLIKEDVVKSYEENNEYAEGGEAVEEKPYQVYNHENQNVEGYFDNEIEAEEFASQFENASVYDIREYAEGGEVEDWMEEALAYLIEETGYDMLEIKLATSNQFIATDGDVEYRVFKTEDDAEETAIEQVRYDLEENAEYFNQDWLMNYIDGRDFFEEALTEMNDSYVQDIESESDRKYANRLIAELVENGIMDEEDAESDNAEELADDLKYDYVALLTQEKLEEGNDGLDYFINNFGEEETYRMVRDNNLIDIIEASRDAVSTDGIAHFLSSYDGETLYLSDDYVAYRIN